MKIRRRCKCGCGKLTNYGKIWVSGHHPNMKGKKHSEETKRKISLAAMGNTNLLGYKHSKETKKKMSLSQIGNVNGQGCKGIKFSEERKLRLSLARLKCNPNYEYCDAWRDKEYKDDIRKDYCENINCKSKSNFLVNHHIYLDKKRCAPNEIMTMCASCHSTLHRLLENVSAELKDFIIINRIDHVSYILKKSRKIIKILKRRKECV